MGRACVVTGRGCCSPSKRQKRISNIASLVFVLLEIVVLAAMLVLNGGVVKMETWLQAIIITIICVQVLIQSWDLKVLLWPNRGEKLNLTIQGSHQRMPSRRKRSLYGVTVSDSVNIEYNRNADGIQVYFRKVGTHGSTTGPFCQPFLLPLKGWFTFFHVLIALTLVICTLAHHSYSTFNGFDYVIGAELGTHPALLSILLVVSSILQIPAVMASYYRAEDCGFAMPGIGYTRWFKHTNAYTDMIQQKIQGKYGEKLLQEGDQLELAIRRNMQKTTRSGVEYTDVGPATAKRYQDQLVLLHLLLAQEHDLVCKEVFPGHNIENKGVSFTLTAEEIDTLNTHAEQAMEVQERDVSNGSVTVDINEQDANDEGASK